MKIKIKETQKLVAKIETSIVLNIKLEDLIDSGEFVGTYKDVYISKNISELFALVDECGIEDIRKLKSFDSSSTLLSQKKRLERIKKAIRYSFFSEEKNLREPEYALL